MLNLLHLYHFMKISRPLVFFYFLVAYVLLQFTWWSYLLIELNKEIFAHKIEMLERTNLNPDTFLSDKALIIAQLKKRWMMVIGEGAVFLSLLTFGIYRTRVAFYKEFELARQQKNFLLSITHEFKSPLAAIKLNLQTLQKRILPPEKQQEILRRTLIETDRIHVLVENSLFASRLENHNYDIYFENFNLSDFIHSTVCDYIERQDHEHQFTHEIAPAIYFNGDKLALTSLLYNLMENAEKYSPLDSIIEIKLLKRNQEIMLCVSDQGAGIPLTERTAIFEKFYRIGNEDTRRTKGTGLGLFIVSHVTNLHKGKITVKDNKPHGSIFEIIFPAT